MRETPQQVVEELLPCKGRRCTKLEGQTFHRDDCPAYYRPYVRDALKRKDAHINALGKQILEERTIRETGAEDGK